LTRFLDAKPVPTSLENALINGIAVNLVSRRFASEGNVAPLTRYYWRMRLQERAMKSLLLAGAMIVATGTCALAQGGYWVVGNRATSKCEIVTSNPVVNAQVGGNIWFGTGPYQSLDDAKLARSTIRGCPAVEEPPAETPDNEKKSD
jgi:hypothetical protein